MFLEDVSMVWNTTWRRLKKVRIHVLPVIHAYAFSCIRPFSPQTWALKAGRCGAMKHLLASLSVYERHVQCSGMFMLQVHDFSLRSNFGGSSAKYGGVETGLSPFKSFLIIIWWREEQLPKLKLTVRLHIISHATCASNTWIHFVATSCSGGRVARNISIAIRAHETIWCAWND